MKTHLFSLFGAALLVAVPTVALLPGCGGGSSGLVQPNTPASQTFQSNLQLSSGQSAALTLKVTGTAANGTLVVPPSSSQKRLNHGTSNLLAAAVAAGAYPVAGTVSANNGFNVSGSFPSPLGDFSIAGQLPVGNINGDYTLTVGDQTASGAFVAPTTTTGPPATATPKPVVTVTPTPPVMQPGRTALDFASLGRGFDYQQGSYSLGWKFSVGKSIRVTSLGFYDDLQDGLKQNHLVGIYDKTTKQLLASTTVLPSDPRTGFFHFHDLATPLVLTTGRDYYVVALTGTERYAVNVTALTVDPAINFKGFAVDYNNDPASTLIYPTTEQADINGDFGPTFRFQSG